MATRLTMLHQNVSYERWKSQKALREQYVKQQEAKAAATQKAKDAKAK